MPFRIVKIVDGAPAVQIVLPAGIVTDGINEGDILRWDSAGGVWEVKAEPLEFQGLVLTPALASLIDAEGAIYYKSDTKSVMVCTDV